MAVPSVFLAAPAMAPGCPAAFGLLQAGSPLEGAVFWLVLAIAIVMGIGLILYLFFVRGSYEREKRAALAIIGNRTSEPTPRDDSYYRSAPSYSYRGDVPDAVAAAMSGIREPQEEEVELVDEERDEELPAYLYSGRQPAPGPRRGAPLPPPLAHDGRVDRPPRVRPREPPRRETSPLDDLLHAGDRDILHEEDRELLREEQLEPEPQVPGLAGEDEEVTFEDEPEPSEAVHPPAPYRVGRREKQVWERVLDGEPQAAEPAYGRHAAQPAREAEVELVDMDGRAPAGPALSRPVADMLLQQDIIKSVKGGAPKAAQPPARGARASPAAPAARPGGPAWSEGRPVFSRPLEEPDVPPTRDLPPATALEDTLGEISHKLRSMDQKAAPRLPPKAESKMGPQERRFLEAMRAVQQKKHEEDLAREEEGHRLLEEQMQELERKKKEEEQKRLAAVRLRERQRLDREGRQQEEMRRWEQARRATQDRLRSGEDARAGEQKARPEAGQRGSDGRRKDDRAAREPSASVDDVLSRIGIKK